jgi:hypothetical protein
MENPILTIRLDGNGRVFRPGETLSGGYRFESPLGEPIKAVEVSVLWHTEGKGDEDLAVHAFWRFSAEDSGQAEGPARPKRFSTVLPNSPLSYEGQIMQIRWCVRVRAFPYRGKELVCEKDFFLTG